MNDLPKEDSIRRTEALDPLEAVMRYHRETKHHFSRYARSLGYMDWANQPDPFRRYDGSPLSVLPLLKPDDAPLSPVYEDLYRDGVIVSAPVSVRSLSRFLEYSLAISAWKQAGAVAEEEAAYTAELCDSFSAGVWITVERTPGGDDIREHYSVFKRLMIGATNFDPAPVDPPRVTARVHERLKARA